MLLTKDISSKLQAQYPLGDDLEKQDVIAKLFDPCSQWTWYIVNQDPDDPDYLWCIVKGFEVEVGSAPLSDLEAIKNALGLPIERDLYFKPQNAAQVLARLLNGEHI